ncbi:ATPase, T2SS/T4P/T4SS family [Paenibacillus segetis]|uniref:Pilus assembly protein CpaF n=1 Tax=Paenibacillus segetis TaxID=1325360 RepID=A0ABQ1YFD1_9BACL|nr:ATPase, T2SS/T4P/T4SS family [Paenibacillus segetis]GGH22724.1 hypothetical protein GCM10008013_21350 [Paenibacillus segetis]
MVFFNLVAIIMIFLICVVYLWLKARSSAGVTAKSKTSDERFTFPTLIGYVKRSLYELSRLGSNDWGMNEYSWERQQKTRAELRQALRGCSFGDKNDKQYVKSYIRDLLLDGYGVNEENIDEILPFHNRDRLKAQDRFEIILYLFTQRYGDEALATLIESYELAEPKSSSEEDGTYSYDIDDEDISHIFYLEYRQLSFLEKLDIVVQRIYQEYKGFSVVDEIREQRIDGVSGGVSGMPEMGSIRHEGHGDIGIAELSLDEDGQTYSHTWDSVWIFYKGKSVRLSFLSFGSPFELKRVCQNIYKFNLPGQLSEANGYKVNEMKDGSRVVVVRPPFAESWAFFVRKFDVKSAVLEQLIQGNNAQLPVCLLKYLMKGSRITAITGSQGSGKTTLLMAMIKHIYASYTLRVQEMSFELNLRKMYSSRNILSFRETEYVSGQAGLDLQKKTDGTVNILGEVSTDEVAAWMIQMAQVASLFTVFTHHAKTFRSLMESLRNSLLKTGMFRNEEIAELQVAGVIDFDVHLRRDITGQRYIERITECTRLDDAAGAEEDNPANNVNSFSYSALRGYQERVIVEYRNGAYVAVHPISARCKEEMAQEMVPEDAERFKAFLHSGWRENIGA